MQTRRRPVRPNWGAARLLASALLLLALCCCGSVYAQAPVRFSIDSQPLASALLVYADQAGLQLMYRAEELPHHTTRALSGLYSPERALAHLLAGTGLAYRFGGGADTGGRTPKVVVVYRGQGSPTRKALPGGEAGGAPASAKPPQRIEEVLVTGIRDSMQRSLTIERHADAVMDVITAEDIGRFPDKNVADSLQRVPGVSVDRIWGEGRDINIRGTDKDINRTLMNGQNVASAYWWADDNPSRGFNYSILASELVASLEVHKTPAADIDEGSIGGTVIIRTRRPLDLAPWTLRTTLEQQYSELPATWDPQTSLFGSWKNPGETFGILASVNAQKRSMRRDGLEAFPDNTRYTLTDESGTVTEDVYVPWGMGAAIFQQQRHRNSANITLQWAPDTGWDLVLNSVVTQMGMDNSNQNYLAVPGGFKLSESPPATVSNAHIDVDGNGVKTLLGATLGNPDTPGAALDAIFRDAFVDSAVYDLDISYAGAGWQAHGQLGLTRAKGGTRHDRIYRFTGDTRQVFSLGPERLEFSFPEIDPRNAADLNRFSSDSRDWIRTMEDEEFYAQSDLGREVEWGMITALKAGIKWRDHTIENHRIAGVIDTSHPDWGQVQAIGLEQVSGGLSPHLNQQTASAGSLTQYAWVDEEQALRVFAPYFSDGLMVYRYDTTAFYEINERIFAAYLRADFETEKLRGNIGVRAVDTRQRTSAFEGDQPIRHKRDYTDFLPSLNAVYDLTDTLLLRAGAARVMARPNFQDIAPGIIVDATNGSASGGNPDLEPFKASQFDIGLEWYFSEGSVLSATGFYKKMSTFIDTRTRVETVNGQLLSVTRPYNAPGADIRGIELQWQQDVGGGFGIAGNYTYTDVSLRSLSSTLPGNSRDQVNASLYYERGGLSARVSYNYRSESFGGLNAGSQDVTDAYDQWDASFGWQPGKQISLYLQAVNITNEVIYRHTVSGVPLGFYENGRRFVVGVRLHF